MHMDVITYNVDGDKKTNVQPIDDISVDIKCMIGTAIEARRDNESKIFPRDKVIIYSSVTDTETGKYYLKVKISDAMCGATSSRVDKEDAFILPVDSTMVLAMGDIIVFILERQTTLVKQNFFKESLRTNGDQISKKCVNSDTNLNILITSISLALMPPRNNLDCTDSMIKFVYQKNYMNSDSHIENGANKEQIDAYLNDIVQTFKENCTMPVIEHLLLSFKLFKSFKLKSKREKGLEMTTPIINNTRFYGAINFGSSPWNIGFIKDEDGATIRLGTGILQDRLINKDLKKKIPKKHLFRPIIKDNNIEGEILCFYTDEAERMDSFGLMSVVKTVTSPVIVISKTPQESPKSRNKSQLFKQMNFKKNKK
eukprot:GHVR01154956.1.p1 GENE.GHVR01154956.1~~GHVR01154956.1.p1  ORF type:complete len:369 (+),score=56.51 GHVR01154956.1:428-1534(+)